MSLSEIPNNASLTNPIGSSIGTAPSILESDITFVTFASLADEQQDTVASWLHQRTSEVDNMLTVEKEDVRTKHLGIMAVKAIMAADGQTSYEIVGYIGATQPEEHDGMEMSEVGSLYVEKAHRKHMTSITATGENLENESTTEMRISEALVYYATQSLIAEGIIPYAFCNEGSLPLFQRADYTEATLTEVPAAAGILCKTSCSLYQACHPDKCCDTIMITLHS